LERVASESVSQVHEIGGPDGIQGAAMPEYEVTIVASKTYIIEGIGGESAMLVAQKAWRDEHPDALDIKTVICKKYIPKGEDDQWPL